MAGEVRIEKEGRIGTLVFDHASRRNAITSEMWRAIPDAARALDEDAGVHVVIMRGAGDVAFVSGADISEFERLRSGDAAEKYDRDNARAFAALAGIAKPVIALVHGFCVGGGCAIALQADLRYAADDSVFAIPAARLGLGYPSGGIETLVRTVGLPAAKEIFFTARRFGAADALRLGIVNQILPKAELDAFVRKLAEDIAANAPLTLRAAKVVMNQLARDQAARDADSIQKAISACYHSADYAEGVRAFLEKRAPDFRGS